MEVRLNIRLIAPLFNAAARSQESDALLDCMSMMALDDNLQQRPGSHTNACREFDRKLPARAFSSVQAFLATSLPAVGRDPF